jgi:hypothetical protein
MTIRTLFYFFGFFLIVSIYGVQNFKLNKLARISFFIILFFSVFTIYPNNFFRGPFVPGEINYFDYKNAYGFALINCNNLYSAIHSPYVSDFYGIQPKLIFFIRQPEDDNRYYIDEDKIIRLVYNNIETTRESAVNFLDNQEDFCLITKDDYRHNRMYLSLSDFQELSKYSHKEFSGLIIYYK